MRRDPVFRPLLVIGMFVGTSLLVPATGEADSSLDLFATSIDRDTDGVKGQREVGDAFGASVAFGDFNGDGFDDLATGTPGDDIGSVDDAGAVNIIYGGADGLQLDNSDLFIDQEPLAGASVELGDGFGYSVVAGDFDGDGFDDVAMSAPFENIGAAFSGADAGLVSIAYGSPDGIDFTFSQAFDQSDFGYPGINETSDLHGWSLAAGDFDGNGKDDLAIGNPYEDVTYGGLVGGVVNAGNVIVLYGTDSGTGLSTSGAQDLTVPLSRPGESGVQFGYAMAAADIDQDGDDDLFIGAPGGTLTAEEGFVMAAFGGSSGLTLNTAAFVLVADSLGPTVSAPVGPARLGASVALSVSPTGFTMAVGAPGYDTLAHTDQGTVYTLTYPADLSPRTISQHSPSERGSFGSRLEGGGFGWAVGLGEFHDDGHLDLVVGSRQGNSVIISGAPDDDFTNDDESSAGDLPASTRVAVGDLNGDGLDDLVLGRGLNEEANPLGYDGISDLDEPGSILVRPGYSHGPITAEPLRFLDTRAGESTFDGAFAGGGINEGGTSTRVKVAGRGGVPDDARTAIVNLAVVNPAGPGYATIYPCEFGAVPTASNLNYSAGETRANTSLAFPDDNGEICIFTFSDAHLVLDVTGSAEPTDEFAAFGPARLLDTRPGESTFDDQFAGIGRVDADSTTEFTAFPRLGNRDDIVAVMLNVAAVNPAERGFLTVYDCGERPVASSLNFEGARTVANGVLTAQSSNGRVCVYSSAETDLAIDLTGFAGRLSGVEETEPLRVFDSRPGEDVDGVRGGEGRVDADGVTVISIGGVRGIDARTTSVSVNLAVVDAETGGFATLFPCSSEVPLAASINFPAGSVTANNAIVALSGESTLCVYSSASAHIILDVTSRRI